jgi:hypothetical protein
VLLRAAGGRGIIDALEKHMQLSRRQVEPIRAALYRFGNVSSTRWDYDVIQALRLALITLAAFAHWASAHSQLIVLQLSHGSCIHCWRPTVLTH